MAQVVCVSVTLKGKGFAANKVLLFEADSAASKGINTSK
jgi:hypothetical protein